MRNYGYIKAQCNRCKKIFKISPNELKLGISKHTCSDITDTAVAKAFNAVKSARKSKFGNERTLYNGFTYSSKKEAGRAQELDLLQKEGAVYYFLKQVPFYLSGNVKYIVDFMIVWKNGAITYEDVKGCETQVFKNKKKQVEALYPIKIEIKK